MMTGKFILLLLACACVDLAAGHAHRPTSPPIRSEISQPPTEGTPSVSVKETEGLDFTSNESEGDDGGFHPETILSVHYDKGMIKELYLSQTRGELTGENIWKPSVSERKRICQDLCEAGLGGDPCGYSCQAATPNMAEAFNQTRTGLNRVVKPYSRIGDNRNTLIGRVIAKEAKGNHPPTPGLASVGRLVREAIRRSRESDEKSGEVPTVESTEETVALGVPRSEVCPTLCLNGLGKPFCTCDTAVQRPSWSSVCNVFCSADSSYQLSGCPVCQTSSSVVVGNSQRLTDPSDFWISWCKIEELMQFRQAELRQKELASKKPDYAWLSCRREEPARINGDQLVQIRALVNKMTPEECASTAARASSILSGRGSHLEPVDIPTLVLELLGCSQTCSLLSSCSKVPRGGRTVRFADQIVYTVCND